MCNAISLNFMHNKLPKLKYLMKNRHGDSMPMYCITQQVKNDSPFTCSAVVTSVTWPGDSCGI